MFEFALKKMLKNEGCYSDNPSDSGGKTKYGISKKSYPNLNIKKLRKGNIILFWYNPDQDNRNGLKQNNYYDSKNGLLNIGGYVETIGHFGIIIDPKKYLILHIMVSMNIMALTKE